MHSHALPDADSHADTYSHTDALSLEFIDSNSDSLADSYSQSDAHSHSDAFTDAVSVCFDEPHCRTLHRTDAISSSNSHSDAGTGVIDRSASHSNLQVGVQVAASAAGSLYTLFVEAF